MESLFKFGTGLDSHPWIYPNVWAQGQTTAGPRLILAPAKKQIEALISLLDAMPEPMWLLYVHVVPRTTDEPGRYQSPVPQTRQAVEHFLRQFEAFLETDGRHHLWIASAESSALLVYDRHNVIYAYGPLAELQLHLAGMDLREVDEISIPDPHSHHYHPSFDPDAERMFKLWDWHYTPLRSSDE